MKNDEFKLFQCVEHDRLPPSRLVFDRLARKEEKACNRRHDAHMVNEAEDRGLVTGLDELELQIGAIRRMIQQSHGCVEILQELAVADAILNGLSFSVLRHHVESCVPAGVALSDKEGRQQLQELVDIFDRFTRQRVKWRARVNTFLFWDELDSA